MAISSELFVDRVLSLLWGVWAGAGVSGWSREDFGFDFAIDPEVFIIATAHFGQHDLRLRDEVANWCVWFFRAIPRVRLKNVLAIQPEGVRRDFGSFAATVNEHSSARWPEASDPFKVEVKPAVRRDLRLPHMLPIRMRGLFGSSARSEVLAVYAHDPFIWLSALDIAKRVHYQKRSVAEALDNLAAAGLLGSRRVGNRLTFGLVDPERLLSFVGAVPTAFPRWDLLFLVLYQVEALLQLHKGPSSLAEVDVISAFSGLTDALASAGLRDPTDTIERPKVWEPFEAWVDELTQRLAGGDLAGVNASGLLSSQPRRNPKARIA